jgi:DUF971 family protein
MLIHLTQFKKNPGDRSFHLKFSDGFEADISSEDLRNHCPCASCKGEEVLLHKYEPLKKIPVSQSGYELVNAEQIGTYALRLKWGDKHDTGIYTWEFLRLLCENNKTN